MSRRPLLTLLAALPFLAPLAASAAGVESFQHGGRATAQAGAFTARADDPSAVTYNPAGIVQLDGLQILGGLDFRNASDDFLSSAGNHRANHTIQFPPAFYLTWKPAEDSSWALGLGLDTPAWYRVEWNTALFPGRFTTRLQEVRFFELHPVAAYQLNERWSVGGGVRYLTGTLEYGFNVLGEGLDPATLQLVAAELEATTEADVDALAFDLGVTYDANVWGFGAVYRSAAKLEGRGDFDLSVRDINAPQSESFILSRFPYDRAEQGFEMPAELRGGLWVAPYPELRIELDASLQTWSSLGDGDVVVQPASGAGTTAPVVIDRPRDWDDTISLRLGIEGDVSEQLSLMGGVALEPSPVPDATREPGYPRGDALVYAVGASYHFPRISFDLGYSYHDYDTVNENPEDLGGVAGGRYSGFEHAWSFSVRWRR
ncbi:MAG TPA: outer membrane protein transport protein [Thermoanaerobaculia bacterium]|nr:outer membrane protein transport protein [Thermoanaerobaculia bacterium]